LYNAKFTFTGLKLEKSQQGFGVPGSVEKINYCSCGMGRQRGNKGFGV
jgi:hypothetical protein